MVHSGSAAGGHYYACIKSFSDDQWYSFNDQHVSKVKIDYFVVVVVLLSCVLIDVLIRFFLHVIFHLHVMKFVLCVCISSIYFVSSFHPNMLPHTYVSLISLTDF